MELLSLLLLLLAFFFTTWVAFLAGKAVARQRLRFDEKAIRKDAVSRSRAVLTGQVSEQLAPFLPGFSWLPGEARFIGKPVDFIVFKGLEARRVDEVVFVEVKSRQSKLSSVERSLRDAIRAKKVSWAEYRVKEKE